MKGCETLKIDILTLFPQTVDSVLHESILGRAAAKGLIEINCVQIRDFTDNKQNQVDDYPYGGGRGCILMAQPLKACLDSVLTEDDDDRTRVIYMSPQGERFTQATARRLKDDYDHLVLVCGHYEGIDERFIEKYVDEEISIGDFVLTGGEIAAMAVTDSVCRLVPGVLSDEECYTGESHWDGLLEYPQYTRPEIWEDMSVPEVLLGGNHAKISAWRRKQQFRRTKLKRPDMYEAFSPLTKADEKLMQEAERDSHRIALTEKLSCRAAVMKDLDSILSISADARAILKKRGIDQWQGEYPAENDFIADISGGYGRIVFHGDEPAAYYAIFPFEPQEYSNITDGKWTEGMKACTVHRVCAAAKYRGTGITDFLCRSIDEQCADSGFRCIRIDTHRKNKAMQHMLTDHGYRYRGNILIDSEPGHDPARQCFEKILKNRVEKSEK